MGAFGRTTPRLLCLCAFTCVVFYFVSYQVAADSQVDSDLVFETKTAQKHANKHNILRRNLHHKESLHNEINSSQDEENSHWLTGTLHRIKRGFDLSQFFSSKSETATPEPAQSQVLDDEDEQEQTEYDDDADNEIDDDDDVYDDSIESFGDPNNQTKLYSPVETDDEDLLVQSGDRESSGEDVVVPVPGKPVYYRVTFTIHEPYIAAYDNPNSKEFITLSSQIVKGVEDLYKDVGGTQSATVIRIQKREADTFTSKVTLDLGSVDYYDRPRIKNKLYSTIQSYQKIGSIQVLTDDFDFRQFEDLSQKHCEAHEIPCRSGECVPATSRCNGISECPDNSDEAGCQIEPTTVPTTIPVTVPATVPVTVPSTSTTTSPPLPVPTPTELPYHDLTPRPSPPSSLPSRCDDGVRCGDSGIYICADQVCDGERDCPDGEDESRCPDNELTTTPAPEKPTACAEGEFSCDLNRCIPLAQRCDGTANCDDRTDERECPAPQCTSGQFRCDDGRCIENSQRCDGSSDCSRGEDEWNCERCPGNQFRCRDGRCIDRTRVCDTSRDCNDGDDEWSVNCPEERCNSAEEFTCGDGKCIPIAAKCDRAYDCQDQSDEKNCPCKPDDFHCKNGFCIPKSQRCDGIRNCQDGTDEIGCTKTGSCEYYQWQCKDGSCIDQIQRCNWSPDCPDRSDEVDCSCRHDEFRCNNGTCISIAKRCDKHADCPFSEDEESCAFCKSEEFRCSNGECIGVAKRCNGQGDCTDGSDEENCDGETASPCQEGEFQCRAGYCIMGYKRCNGFKDCPSGNDEENCPLTTTTPPEIPCEANEFRCGDGQCIDQEYKCDSVADCQDGSDEKDCGDECVSGEIKCGDGTCGRACDDIIDCEDGSDEENCGKCAIDEFQCNSGECIEEDARCNKRSDCKDGSDEIDCARCAEDEFDCGSHCIESSRTCDGYSDCDNGEDELNCVQPEAHVCHSSEFTCNNGACIPSYQYCDGSLNCPDGSDERDCGTCVDPDWFQCSDGACIAGSLRCDNYYDCKDFSDEQNCFGCRPDEFICASGQCIPQGRRCDDHADCQDGSDEVNCPTKAPPHVPEEKLLCQPHELPCRSRNECYPITGECDGYPHCSDRTDESNCHDDDVQACLEGHFRCENGPCLREELRCDGKVDCPFDSSDELDCPQYAHGPYYPSYPSRDRLDLKTYPNAQDIKESIYKPGREVVFQCRDEGPLRARVHWIRASGEPLPPGSRDINGRLEMPNIQVQHSGTYVCEALGSAMNLQGSRVSVHLNVERLETPSPRPPLACGLYEATCANGDCIAKHLVCDGNFDCKDGSDETRCSQHGCEPNEFRCANKRCVLKTWVCDSDNDCGDGTDEANCATNPPGSPCGYHQFACSSGNQCIPRSFHCDHQRDCVDGSDEFGCSPVAISRPPPPMKELVEGSIFIITCTAVGVPTPEIMWRLNWGHIPEKCTTTSVGGVGTLTCPDVRENDQGAYSCEAINIFGTVIAVPDTILVVTRPTGRVCPRGFFNEEARSPSECISCFCFGVIDECSSADLFTYQLQPPFDAHRILGVRVDPNTGVVDVRDDPIYRGVQPALTPTRGRNGVHAYLSEAASSIQPNIVPYFVMPENYNGNQLKSYGGYLKYNLRYDGYGRPTTRAPDVIITGNGYTLLYVGKHHQPAGTDLTVRFFVGEWVKRSDTAPETLATREEIMMALASVNNILIKLQYVEGHLDTTIDNIEMDSAAVRNTGLGQAVFVEECRCPVGYAGLSCETCAPGYSRHSSGPWLGKCYKEPEICPPGTYGDPSRGIPCETCPCPLTNPTNQFGRTCSLAPDGDVICDCPPGYVGRRCEQCAAGYTGNPLQVGDSCRPSYCNLEGSLYPDPDSSGRCVCKDLTDGSSCNQCKPNTFHLSADNQFGCIACFCMGITQNCRSSNWYRDFVSTAFTRSRNDFKIVDAQFKESPIDQGIALNQDSREIVYSNFSSRAPEVKYWYLPSRFLGDKVTSYGGNLKYSLRYVPAPGGQSSRNTAPDVELISKNHIKLWYFHRDQLLPNTVQNVSVPLLEQYWQRNDGQKADREHLLMALADVEAILIKATYTTNSREVALRSVSLDVADERNTGLARALAVEQCQCPSGYTGLSCEDCAVGYKRATEGIYLALCERCECNGYSNECEPETGECLNCRDFTTGPNCDQCLPNYQGDPANRVPCKYTGGVDNCICDERGSIGSSCQGGSCQCKTNVIGQTCNRCRDGTFGLNASLPEGCQSCFCSGVATECSESNLFIEQIPSQIFDPDEHGFTLTDQYNTRRISSGFQLNVAMNEIGYVFRPSENDRIFWSLPSAFTGNKVKSYGGRLEFTQRYTQRPHARYMPDQDVIIIGNGITIYWTNHKVPEPNIANKFSLVLSPSDKWQRLEHRQGQRPASREDILRVLTNIDAILIRAQPSGDTASSYVSDITLDTAVDSYTGQDRASNIEVCRCPAGYRGTSCESCTSGYYRDVNDIHSGPLGSCSRCPCNNNEENCSLGPDNRVICNCLPGYTGPDCASYGYTTDPVVVTTPSPPAPPTIIVRITNPSLEIVNVGSNVRLSCQAQTSAPNAVKIEWSKDGGILPNRAIDDHRGILVITDVRISDSGRYICQASDGVSIVSQHITLTVGGNEPTAPTVVVTPNYIDVNEGEQIELRCQADGYPAPHLQWTRVDGSYLTPYSFVNGILTIRNASPSNRGQYQCTATNSVGTQTGYATVNVHEVKQEVREPIVTPPYHSGQTGDSFTLTCETNENYRSIRWSKHSGYLPYNSRDQNGILTITDAKPEDSGVYICTVTLLNGLTGNKSATVTISRSPVGGYPVVRTNPRNQTAAQGSTVELYCEASGFPTPSLKWTKVHDQLPHNARQQGSTLRIDNIQIHDRGIYVCVASNTNGISQDSTYLEVERRERPTIELYPEAPQTVNEGGSAILQCRVTGGTPQPNVVWTRSGGQPLSRSIEQLSSGVLRFTRITLADSGEYICTASNQAGSITASGSITVQVPPRITITPSDTVKVKNGDRVYMECRATGVPLPSVHWSRYSIPEVYSIAERKDKQMAVLEITSASSSDEDTYVCRARNDAGIAEERVQLIVDSYPSRGDIVGNRSHSSGEDPGSDKDDRPYTPYRPPTRDNEHPPNIFDETFTAPVGTRAELRCRANERPGQIYFNWIRADNTSLPRDSTVHDGILYINNVQPSDSGEYRCLGIEHSGGVLFTVTANLVVLAPPRITLEPTRQVVRPGDNALIQCKASGDLPITITWHAIDRELPSSVDAYGGDLRFQGIKVSDAGRYRCTATNTAGEADAVAEVLVDEKEQRPTVSADNRDQTASVGSSVTLHCTVAPGIRPDVRWYREHKPLPANSRLNGEYLTIVNLHRDDAGRYFCEVATGDGYSSDYVNLHVEFTGMRCRPNDWQCGDGTCIRNWQRCNRYVDCVDISDELYCRHRRHAHNPSSPNTPELQIDPSSPTTRIGDVLDLTCRSNEPGVITTWSKVNGRFADNVQTSGGTIRFNSVRYENTGTYRCEARGYSGSYHQDYSVDIIDSNEETTRPPLDIKTAPQGSMILMECKTRLEEPISYQWTKQGGRLPSNVNAYSRTIQINDVSSNDAGTYVCAASNGRRNVDITTILVVTGIVPYFTQAPNSFLLLQTLPDAYISFNLEISFRPKRPDGLILYNGANGNEENGDFISLALQNGVPEFRFNLGHPVTIVRGDRPVELGKWHTVKIIRHRKKGSMYVDGQGPFVATSQSKYSGISLKEPLYLGGVPDYRKIAPEAEVTSGFVGCISQLKIGHSFLDILREASLKSGVTTCETCSENPCQNQGVCQEALSREGFSCICPDEYSGPTCNKMVRDSCTPYACGIGRCVDNEYSYECYCPIGQAGSRCEREIAVNEPAFKNNSYVAYPTLKAQRRVKISMKIKPKDLNNGVLLYCGEDDEGHGDFASLSLKDGYIEFRFDVGNGPTIIRNEKRLQPDEWVLVTATRSLSEGRLVVNGEAPAIGKSPGNHKALSLYTPLYVGGYDKTKVRINEGVGVTSGFNGCISEISVSGLNLNIIESATDSSNVLDCSTDNDDNQADNELGNGGTQFSHDNSRSYDMSQTGCTSNPCRNEGQCYPVSQTDYLCTCANGYTGRDCEIAPNQCDQLTPCQNGGTCTGSTTYYVCDCPMGYTGTNCEQRAELRNDAHFDGNGYLEFSPRYLPHTNDEENEVIAFELSTNSSNGLIFWHGQTPNEDGRGQDFIALAVVNDYLEFSFDLGSGPVEIVNRQVRISDGKRHKVVLKRQGKFGTIEIDDEYLEVGTNSGLTNQMNCNGYIYLGGTPNLPLMTGRFNQGFSGCIHGFEIQDSQTIELGVKAVSGVNVKACSSSEDEYDEDYEETVN